MAVDWARTLHKHHDGEKEVGASGSNGWGM